MKKLIALIPLFLFASYSLLASDFPHVDADLKFYDDQIIITNSEFNKFPVDPQNKEWVKVKIKHMLEIDQFMRHYLDTPFNHQYNNEEKKEFELQFSSRSKAIDLNNLTDLKDLLKIYQWFKISEFGNQADKEAWLLVQHADSDPTFQKQVLSILTGLYQNGETNPSNYAYLWDRIAASWGDQSKRTLQRYGTQGFCIAPEVWQPLPVEDPDHLDERRRNVGLGIEADYIKVFKNICH